jgi:hypothetical protein
MYIQSTAPVLIFYVGLWIFMTVAGGPWLSLVGGAISGFGIYQHFKSQRESEEAFKRMQRSHSERESVDFNHPYPPDWP